MIDPWSSLGAQSGSFGIGELAEQTGKKNRTLVNGKKRSVKGRQSADGREICIK